MAIKIEVGGVYTNSSGAFAREILEIDDQKVAYRDFVLSSGEPLSTRRQCSRATLRNWATRKCTLGETGRLQRRAVAQEDVMLLNMAGKSSDMGLKSVSDSDLLAEARRRGLV